MGNHPIANEPNLVELQGRVISETQQAVLIMFDGFSTATWVPKSQMEDWPDVGDSGDVLIQEWIAIEKDLI